MKCNRSQLLILASLLTYTGIPELPGVPGLNDNTLNHWVGIHSAHAGQDDLLDGFSLTSAGKGAPRKKGGLFKRLKDLVQTGSEPTPAATRAQAPHKSKATETSKESKPKKSPAPSTTQPAEDRADFSFMATTAPVALTSYEDLSSEEPLKAEPVAPKGYFQREKEREKVSIYHQLPTQNGTHVPLTDRNLVQLQGHLAYELQQTNREMQGLNQRFNELHEQTCDAENRLNACRKAETVQRERIEKVKQGSVRAAFKLSLLESKDESAIVLQDQLALSLIQKWTQTGKWALLAVGNPQTASSPEVRKELRRLAINLNSAGYEILYDADSSAAEVFSSELDRISALGISGNPQLRTLGDTSTLVIENPYLRMQALRSASKIILTPDSILGIGLLVEDFTAGDKTFLVFDPENRWKKGLSTWQASLSDSSGFGGGYSSHPYASYSSSSGVAYDPIGNRYEYANKGYQPKPERIERSDRKPRNMGIRYPLAHEPRSFAKAAEIITHLSPTPTWEFRRNQPEPATFLRSTLPTSLLKAIDTVELPTLIAQEGFSRSYMESVMRLRQHGETHQFYNAGAAFFGSKESPADYEKLVKDVIQGVVKHGFPIATGGSGGLMDTANRVAKTVDGFSIGVPYGGSKETAASHLHDLTLPTTGYEQRIPLILRDKNLILIAPGGTGTMKELATTFVQMAAANPQNLPVIMFIGTKYYEEFGIWLNGILPELYLSKMALVDSAGDFEALYAKYFN